MATTKHRYKISDLLIIWIPFISFVVFFAIINHMIGTEVAPAAMLDLLTVKTSGFTFADNLLTFLSSFCVLVFLFYKARKDNNFKIIFVAYLIRYLVLYVGTYRWFYLLFNDLDSYGFNEHSIYNMQAGSIHDFYGGWYTPIISVLYILVGPFVLSAGYMNVLFFTDIIILMNYVMSKMEVSRRTAQIALLLFAIQPICITLSSILLRDMLLQLCIFFSCMLFLKWMNTNRIRYMLLACLVMFPAFKMHAGTVVLVFAYPFAFFMYSHIKGIVKKDSKTLGTVGSFCLISGVIGSALLLTNSLGEEVGARFWGTITGTSTIVAVSYSGDAGSGYLKCFTGVTGFWQTLLITPLLLFYFCFSPMPWNMRGLGDMIAFFGDAIIYIYLFYVIFKKKKFLDKYRLHLVNYLLLSVLLVYTFFGLGTYTSGTAMRHRCKCYSVLLLCYAVCQKDKKSGKKSIGN